MSTLCDRYVDEDIEPMTNIEALEKMATNLTTTAYAPAGTCAIGKVVTPDLCVIGVSGLRVVDASVMPHLTSGGINAPTIMIAEKVCAWCVLTAHVCGGSILWRHVDLCTGRRALLPPLTLTLTRARSRSNHAGRQSVQR